jgi:hypothetical protein
MIMPKYIAYAVYTASQYLGEIEADTKEEAEEKAYEHEELGVILCHQCSDKLCVGEQDRVDLEKIK